MTRVTSIFFLAPKKSSEKPNVELQALGRCPGEDGNMMFGLLVP